MPEQALPVDQTMPHHRHRLIFIWIGLAALVAAALVNFGYLRELAGLVRQVRWYVLVAVVSVQALSYWANAKYYQSVLEMLGYYVRLRDLYEAALAINFVNQVFPSGGLSSAAYLSRELRGRVPTGKATLVQLMRYIFMYLAFVAVLLVGFLFLFLAGDVARLTIRVALLLILGLLVGNLFIITALGDRGRLEWVVRRLAWVANTSSRRLRRGRILLTPERINRFISEFYHGYELIMADKRAWRRPLSYALMGGLAEVATVFVVFTAFGAMVNPGIVIAAYTLANLASLLSFFSSGLGSYEVAMVATLVFLGVPLALALSVTIFYRAFNLALFLPLGFHFYRKRL